MPCDWSDDHLQPLSCIFELVSSKGTGWSSWSDDHLQPLTCIFELVYSKGTECHVIGQMTIHSHFLVYWELVPSKGTDCHVIGQMTIHSHFLVYWSWYTARVQVVM